METRATRAGAISMQKMCMRANSMSRVSISVIASTMDDGEWFVRVPPKVFASISVTTTGCVNRATAQLVSSHFHYRSSRYLV